MSNNTQYNKTREFRPQWMVKEKPNVKYTTAIQNLAKHESSAKDRRRAYLNSEEFNTKYYIPVNLVNDYINNSWFDLEYYSIENIHQKDLNKSLVHDRGNELYNNCVDRYTNYVCNLDGNSLDFDNYFYLDDVFIDESLDLNFKQNINEVLKEEFLDNYFDPFSCNSN